LRPVNVDARCKSGDVGEDAIAVGTKSAPKMTIAAKRCTAGVSAERADGRSSNRS